MAELNYSVVGGPPADWNNVEICFDGKWSGDWIEVNAAEGWGIRFAKDADGEFLIEVDHYKRETVKGDFTLRYREP